MVIHVDIATQDFFWRRGEEGFHNVFDFLAGTTPTGTEFDDNDASVVFQ
jgi:hypothetical protein